MRFAVGDKAYVQFLSLSSHDGWYRPLTIMGFSGKRCIVKYDDECSTAQDSWRQDKLIPKALFESPLYQALR